MSLWLAAALVLLGAAAVSLVVALQRPGVIAGLLRIIAGIVVRSALSGLSPRDFTEKQRQALREGRDPFRDRPHGGHD